MNPEICPLKTRKDAKSGNRFAASFCSVLSRFSRTKIPHILAAFCGLFAFAWLSLPKPPLLDGIDFSQRILDRDGRLLYLGLTRDHKYRVFTPLADISPELIAATLAHEDRWFRSHPGINAVPVLRAAWRVVTQGRSRAGASTITMQLARMSGEMRTRSLRGKLAQMWRALGCERHYTKDEILEAYLNLAPYGGNIEGIGAASEILFQKPPARLTRPEAVTLSVIPQSPARRAPRPGVENPMLTAAHHRLLARMGESDSLEGDWVPQAMRPRGMRAPHFTTGVAASHRGESVVRTTLDLTCQEILERRIESHVARRRDFGIRNAAALLLDARTMEVLAQVGSADFFDPAICGQVDATQAARSPGSALKPFVYALAMEQGLIHPLTMIADTPRSFGGYDPENFDREFAGPLTAAEALMRSRNVPAVSLAAQLRRPTLYGFLRAGGVRLSRGENHYGLALPLGGAEVTMEDLVRLYAVLANEGQLRPIQRTFPHGTEAKRLLSPEAAFLTRRMLTGIPRPDMADASRAPVAWKTGTSHGFRDAWSVAIFDGCVLAVWIGNADGRGNPAFIGRSAAGPLLFQIIDALRAAGRVQPVPDEPPTGANLRQVELCAVSGELPTLHCPRRINGWFIPGVSPVRECAIHREIFVDAHTGLRLGSDDGSRPVRREVHEFWPADLMALFDRAGLPRRRPPPFAPGSAVETLARSGRAPHILSPRPGLRYTLRDERSTLPLRAETDADATRIYWFANKQFLGAAPAREPLEWRGAPGTHTILALDDQGRSASCEVTLRASAL